MLDETIVRLAEQITFLSTLNRQISEELEEKDKKVQDLENQLSHLHSELEDIKSKQKELENNVTN